MLVKIDSSQWELSRHAFGKSQIVALVLAHTPKPKRWIISIEQDEIGLTNRLGLTDLSSQGTGMHCLGSGEPQPPQGRIG